MYDVSLFEYLIKDLLPHSVIPAVIPACMYTISCWITVPDMKYNAWHVLVFMCSYVYMRILLCHPDLWQWMGVWCLLRSGSHLKCYVSLQRCSISWGRMHQHTAVISSVYCSSLSGFHYAHPIRSVLCGIQCISTDSSLLLQLTIAHVSALDLLWIHWIDTNSLCIDKPSVTSMAIYYWVLVLLP